MAYDGDHVAVCHGFGSAGSQAVTQDEIDDMKSQASSLKEQQADLQSKLDELETPRTLP